MSKSVTRRLLLRRMAATAIFSPAVFGTFRPSRAAALPALPNLPSSEALLLRPPNSNFDKYEPAYNKRTMPRMM